MDIVGHTHAPAFPVPFSESLETLAPDETKVQIALSETLTGISRTTFEHAGHATRGVHAKSHGVLHAELRVLPGLSETLSQGLFATEGTYSALMRFSTIPGDMLDDAVSTPRGLALKIIGVTGERLPGSEGEVTQDFVLANSPAFGAPDAKAFLGSLKMLARTTDRAPALKKLGSRLARALEAALEKSGSRSGLILTMGGHPATNILGETYYSQVPIRYGDYVAKIALMPVSDGLRGLTDAPVAIDDHPNALREAVQSYFAVSGGTWEIRVQLCTDVAAMPIENATVIWPEDQSPYVPVATLVALPQDSWSAASVRAIDEGAAFSPWHGLAAHRPLGSVMRARRMTYANSAAFRSHHNGCPIHEPRVDATPDRGA